MRKGQILLVLLIFLYAAISFYTIYTHPSTLPYTLLLAERSPIFGIAGTDPNKLETSVQHLEEAESALMQVQKTPAERDSIRALYPTHFLHALAKLEEARRSFLASRSLIDATRYVEALDTTARAGSRDAQAFSAALKQIIGDTEFRIPLWSGTVTRESLTAAAATIEIRMQEVALSIQRFKQCFAGDEDVCRSLTTKKSTAAALVALPNTQALQTATALAEDLQLPVPKHILTIATSSCLSLLPGPYSFTLEDTLSRSPVRYTDDLFFYRTSTPNAPTLNYLRKTYGISLSLFGPMTFYACPELQNDLGTLRALEAAQATSSTYSKIEIARMVVERSAGLDALVASVAAIDMHDVQLYQNGVPFDVSARRLFMSHSALPSLFLAGNASAGSTSVELVVKDLQSFKQLQAETVRYSQIKKSTSLSDLTRDIRQYFLFEGIMP